MWESGKFYRDKTKSLYHPLPPHGIKLWGDQVNFIVTQPYQPHPFIPPPPPPIPRSLTKHIHCSFYRVARAHEDLNATRDISSHCICTRHIHSL